ncbi:MAG: hypothetical protein AAF558_01135 [Verrucomicrobiota bacterium]
MKALHLFGAICLFLSVSCANNMSQRDYERSIQRHSDEAFEQQLNM